MNGEVPEKWYLDPDYCAQLGRKAIKQNPANRPEQTTVETLLPQGAIGDAPLDLRRKHEGNLCV